MRKNIYGFISKSLVTVIAVATVPFMSGCASDKIGTIDKVVVSPSGVYQAEVVQVSYGATGGRSDICVEVAKDGESFPTEGEQNTKKSIEISETRSFWGASFDIEWISDNTFTVITNPEGTHKDYYLVEMSGKKYTVTEGLTVDEQKTRVEETKIDGDNIEITCTLYVKNIMNESVSFSASTYVETKGFPKGVVRLSTDESAQEELQIGPNEEKAFSVVLYGEKKADEEFTGGEPNSFFVSIVKFGDV